MSVVRSLDELMQVWTVRSLVFIDEQNCPYAEEFDGNDLAGATHLLARIDGEPVGVLRIRWFADFAKIERIAVRSTQRSGDAASALVETALSMAARKGYRKALGHIQARLLKYWQRRAGVSQRPGRPRFSFSDYDYVEVERALTPPANAIGPHSPALVLLRPEGDWDKPGVLDRSAQRRGAAPGQ